MRERCSEICPGDELKTKQDTKRTPHSLVLLPLPVGTWVFARKTPRGYAAARCADQSDCPVCGRTVAQNNRVLRLAFPPLFPLSLPLRPTFVTGHAVQGWTGRSSNTFAKKRQRVNATFKKYMFLNFWWRVRTHDTSSRFHKSIQRHIKELKLPYNRNFFAGTISGCTSNCVFKVCSAKCHGINSQHQSKFLNVGRLITTNKRELSSSVHCTLTVDCRLGHVLFPRKLGRISLRPYTACSCVH